MGFASDILTKTDAVIVGYTSGAWSAIVSAHMGAIRAALILYIAIYGWCVLNNWIETTLSDAFKHVLKMGAVFAVATSWGWFHMFFYDVFANGPDSFIAALTGGDTSKAGLDAVFATGFGAGNAIFRRANWYDLPQIFIAGLVILLTLMAVAYALFLLILSKFALAIILAIGALFIVMHLFNATRGLFSSWVNALLNYALVPILTYALLHLMLKIMQTYTTKLAAATAAGTVAFGDVPGFFLFSVITFVVLMQVPTIAASLTGGFGLTTAGAPATLSAASMLGARWAAQRMGRLGRYSTNKARDWYRARRNTSRAQIWSSR
jgi:type IV secretion system protein VirB6